MTRHLPTWADSNKGRAILSAIAAEQPGTRIVEAMGFHYEQYAGRNAQRLRDLFNDQLAAITGAEREAYEAGKCFDELSRQANLLLKSERPDELIERVLSARQAVAA